MVIIDVTDLLLHAAGNDRMVVEVEMVAVVPEQTQCFNLWWQIRWQMDAGRTLPGDRMLSTWWVVIASGHVWWML